MSFPFKESILGGTFDQFHVGHQKLLDTAFEQSAFVTIGITQPHMYQHKLLSSRIDDFSARKQAVTTYLTKKKYLRRAKIISIGDMYGDSLKTGIDAIFATHANLPNVRLINKKRKEHNLAALRVVTVPTITGDDRRIVTSERIRLGEIDKNGKSYLDVFKGRSMLVLPERLREAMRHPLGE